MSDYSDLLQYMLDVGYDQINGYDFYVDIFPDCENQGELSTDFSKPNSVYLYYDGELDRMRRRIMLKDTWEDDYMEFVEENSLTLCSGLMYRGKTNKLQHAQQMNALIFDIDGVGEEEFRIIEGRWEIPGGRYRAIPKPTYVSLSGNGVHLYYVFEEPIALFPNIKVQLKSLKYDLTFSIWEYGETSKEATIQYQSINQSFRMPGSYNCKYDKPRRVEAFRVGDRVTIDYLNEYVVDDSNRVDIERPFKPTKMTRLEAQAKFPEWYERVIINGIKKPKKWMIDEKVNGEDPYALYHWWMKQGRKIVGGHRYYFLMCMAIYADKCNVPWKVLVKDMEEIFDEIASIPHKNELTIADMNSALEAYSKEYYDTSIAEINYWTGVGIERNKRNGRSQERHLEIARGDKADMKKRGKPFRNPEGRPPGKSRQRDMVIEFKRTNPEATPAECIRETGVSRNTVYKWWKEE